MMKWFTNMFKSTPDKVEIKLLKLFDFLLNKYDFKFSKEKLGDAVDENGKLIFYGPLNAYQFYNKNICVSILHLVQMDEYNVYISDIKSVDQVNIRKGTEIPSYLEYNLPLFAKEVEESVLNHGELYGYKIL